jgi:hypothetical protein
MTLGAQKFGIAFPPFHLSIDSDALAEVLCLTLCISAKLHNR